MLTGSTRSRAAAYGLRSLGAGIAEVATVVLPAESTSLLARAIPAAATEFMVVLMLVTFCGLSDSLLVATSKLEMPKGAKSVLLSLILSGCGMMGVAIFMLPARSNVATRIAAVGEPRVMEGGGRAEAWRGDGGERRMDASREVDGGPRKRRAPAVPAPTPLATTASRSTIGTPLSLATMSTTRIAILTLPEAIACPSSSSCLE